MIVVKDGAKMELDNDNHIAAFLSSGWVEAKASAPAAEEPKPEEAVEIAEIMPAPVEAEVEEKPEVVAPAPKRGRKKAVK